MMPLVFILPIIAGILALAAPFCERKVTTGVYWTGILVLILLAGLRWRTGTDWDPYLQHFEEAPLLQGEVRFDIGYELIVSGFRLISANYTLFLLLFGSLTIGIKAWVFSRLPNPLGALFFYLCLCFADVFFVRQSLAISLIGLAFYLFPRKPLVAIVLSMAAALIHASAALPMLLLVALHATGRRSNWRVFVCSLSLAGAVCYCALEFGRVADKVDDYFVDQLMPSEGGPLRVIGRGVLAICYFLGYVHIRRSLPSRLRWFGAASFTIAVLANLVAEPLVLVSVIFTRFFQFASFFEVVAAGLLWSKTERKDNPVTMGLLFCIASIQVIRMVGNFHAQADLLHPFEFCWDDSFKVTY